MKYSNKISIQFLFSIFLGIGISSCTNEDPTVLTTKPTEQFIKQYKDFYTAERLIMDSCYAGYVRANMGYRKGYVNESSKTKFLLNYNAYLLDLRADSTLLAKPDVTMAELVAIHKKMAVSGNTFMLTVNVCDRQELADSITSATKILLSFIQYSGVAVSDKAVGKVLAYDRGELNTAINGSTNYNNATKVRDNATFVQAQVDIALNGLRKAIPIYRASVIDSDLPTYQAKCLAYVIGELARCYKVDTGYAMYQYVPYLYNNYVSALKKDSILADLNSTGKATTVEIMAKGMITLGSNNPPSGPRVAFFPSLSDRKALNDSINTALTLYAKIKAGPSTGQVSTLAKTNFMNAITFSRDNILYDYSKIDTDISSTIVSLSTAKLNFINAIIK